MKRNNVDPIRFFEGVLRDMEDDPEVIAHEPIEEVEAYLREHGLEKEPFLAEMRGILAEAAAHGASPSGTPPEQGWFGPLSLFPSPGFSAQAVAAAVTRGIPPSTDRAEAFKEVGLDELLDFATAKEVLPWIGHTIRVSRTTDVPTEPCTFVVSIDVDPIGPARGALRISLRSDDGLVREVTLNRTAPAAIISEAALPPDWRRITISATSIPD